MFDKNFKNVIKICASVNDEFLKHLRFVNFIAPPRIKNPREEVERNGLIASYSGVRMEHGEYEVEVDLRNDKSYLVNYQAVNLGMLERLSNIKEDVESIEDLPLNGQELISLFYLSYDDGDNEKEYAFDLVRLNNGYYICYNKTVDGSERGMREIIDSKVLKLSNKAVAMLIGVKEINQEEIAEKEEEIEELEELE